ncbi:MULTISPECIES: flagellar hook-associated protein FlgK [Halobacteriovorax]|uniref:Flagellar hook-associated protein 1 n=1 Tax=Halobacteriovorax vibrionivorans TaxID=2152716 RepID=A0ABY0IP48_9BACT|nr:MULTISPECIES: flagellar hook-associated protein FlgK [Halobacteriovorax]AYF45939.1 flagellar hook-associated protein FlgK [Halobacteriovorax sp. BALOs_7]RZF22972.1 flagellar hook-associated protein FlgK [Halobacteriovorax vibrionivorans]TGD46885.1 flagellar hook-associated protein FlgK [Halobacteriovorax sp. Y22]
MSSRLLNIGNTGLSASKKALEVTSHNISNANTEGYSRQRVHQQANTPLIKDGLVTGSGTRIRDINRVHDKFVEKKLRDANTDKSYYDNRSQQMGRIEDIFNEIDNQGLNQILNNFFNSFRDLANQPENETVRSVVRDKAQLIVKDFRRIAETLDEISRSIDDKISLNIKDANQHIETIGQLNRKIRELEANGDETGDMRDQRDLAIKELSKIVKIHTYEDERGNYNVQAPGVGTLVTAAQTQTLGTYVFGKEDSTSGQDGSVEVFWASRSGQQITEKFKGGSLGAVIKVRNHDIKALREKLDQTAFEFMNYVNAIHRRGFVNREIQTDAQGNPVTVDSKGPTTGLNFFKEPTQIEGAALRLDLSDAIKSDVSNIATALSPNSPGDNRVAIAISKLQHERLMGDGTATIEEDYLKTVGNVGLETGKAKLDAEQSEGLLAQANSIRERISGVSIDEEAANMIKYQHAYEAAAKVMQTANEMFDTVLSIKQ